MLKLKRLFWVIGMGFAGLLQMNSWGGPYSQALAADRLSKSHTSDPSGLIRLTISETRLIVREILDQYPKDQWYYLCIGRSLTSSAEGLRLEAGDDSVRTIPISGSKYLNPIEIADPTLPQWIEPTEILARLLPTQEELHGRGLLILDYTLTGASFANQMEIVERIFRKRDGKVPYIRGRAYGQPTNPLVRRNLQFYPVDYAEAPVLLADAWFSADFDWWAEYDDWRPSVDLGAPVKNKRYLKFRETFRHYWSNPERPCESPLVEAPKFSF